MSNPNLKKSIELEDHYLARITALEAALKVAEEKLQIIASTVCYSEEQLGCCDEYQLMQMAADAFLANQTVATEALDEIRKVKGQL